MTKELPARSRRLAVALQEPRLLDMRWRANVRLGLALCGLPRDEQRRRAAYWLERLGIAHRARRSPPSPLGRRTQPVSPARALAPETLLLDEPCSSLDPPMRRERSDELDSLHRVKGTTAVLVMHDRTDALPWAIGWPCG